jgi:hypothetical protein
MTRTLTALFVTAALAAFPALGQRSGTKVRTNTNPAGSHTMVMTKSGQGANRTMSKTMTNTEGNKVLTSSRTLTHKKANRGHRALKTRSTRGRKITKG